VPPQDAIAKALAGRPINKAMSLHFFVKFIILCSE
jgi:hypothetical protein